MFPAPFRTGLGAAPCVALVPGTARRARVEPVPPLTAGVRVDASVPPREPLNLPLRVEQLGFEIHVRPPETEAFPLPESHADADHPAEEGGPPGSCGEEGFRLFDGERVRLGLVSGRRVHEGRNVLHDHPAAVRDFQRARQDAVHLEHVRGGVSGVEHGPIHMLKVLGGELVDAVLANPGDDVVAGLGPVVVQGTGLEFQAGDVGEVGLHPRRHGRLAACFRGASVVAQGLQVLDLALNFRFGPGPAVAPVGPAVAFDSHGDAAVPPAVAAEVDGRLHVGFAGAHGSSTRRGGPNVLGPPQVRCAQWDWLVRLAAKRSSSLW